MLVGGTETATSPHQSDETETGSSAASYASAPSFSASRASGHADRVSWPPQTQSQSRISSAPGFGIEYDASFQPRLQSAPPAQMHTHTQAQPLPYSTFDNAKAPMSWPAPPHPPPPPAPPPSFLPQQPHGPPWLVLSAQAQPWAHFAPHLQPHFHHQPLPPQSSASDVRPAPSPSGYSPSYLAHWGGLADPSSQAMGYGMPLGQSLRSSTSAGQDDQPGHDSAPNGELRMIV